MREKKSCVAILQQKRDWFLIQFTHPKECFNQVWMRNACLQPVTTHFLHEIGTYERVQQYCCGIYSVRLYAHADYKKRWENASPRAVARES